ncbi:hypothetical protein ACWCQP_50655 [Streptomyces chartreusis]
MSDRPLVTRSAVGISRAVTSSSRELAHQPLAPPARFPGQGAGATHGRHRTYTDSLGQYEASVARGRALEKLRPEGPTPSSAWFLKPLTGAPLPRGVHRTASDGDPLMTLCTMVADLSADRIVVRGPQGGTAELPLSDFAQGVAPERAGEPPSVRV